MNGWFHTDDIAAIDEDGYIYIRNRKKDMIISGGINIFPREIEEVLFAHPAILEAAVVGKPDVEWGEIVKAVVVLKEGMTAIEQEIIDYAKARLVSYKKPKEVVFMKNLPKTTTGKVIKAQLRKAA